MDPVDILTLSVHAAQLIRSGDDPEQILAGAYQVIDIRRPDDGDDPLALRIVRLVDAADEKRKELLDFLNQQSGPLPLNRPSKGWGGAIEPGVAQDESAFAEAEELLKYTETGTGLDVMGDFPSFSVAQKRVSGYFGGGMIIVRDGQRLTEDQAGEMQSGDVLEPQSEDLPTTVRGLIDYPLERPCLFTIDVGDAPWSVWDICCAFAEQYARIYEQPEHYGIWGHDITDLWIERLFYIPEKKLLYPFVGS